MIMPLFSADYGGSVTETNPRSLSDVRRYLSFSIDEGESVATSLRSLCET